MAPLLLFASLFAQPAFADGAGAWSSLPVPEMDADRTGPPPTTARFQVTKTGLRIAQLAPCSAPKPQQGQTVHVHYDMWVGHALGPVVDSSYKRGTPFQYPFQSGRVIQGFDEAIATMSPGCKIRVIIPPAMGYGVKGRPGTIPPNTDLVFDIEMLSITP